MSTNYWLRQQLEEEEEEARNRAVLDKIEAARSSYDDPWPCDDARQDSNNGNRQSLFDVITDEEDGILAMLYEVRDMLFPLIEQEVERDDHTVASVATRSSVVPDWQATTAEEFMRAWHQVEVSTAARMLATDEDDASMLAMFREIGTATYEELSSGSRQLSDYIVANMRIALEAVQRFSDDVYLLADAVLVPEPVPALTVVPARDVSMAAMFRPEEWH